MVKFGAEIPNGVAYLPEGTTIGDLPLPHLLQPHHEASWALPLDMAQAMVSAASGTWPDKDLSRVRMFVQVAGRQKIYARGSLRLSAD